MLFASMSIGQLFNKHKIWGSILGYVVFYIITQIAMAIILTITTFSNMFDNIMLSENVQVDTLESGLSYAGELIGAMNLYFITIIIIEVVLAIVYFLISRYLLTRKLNLQ